MPSETYGLFHRAMAERKQILCDYQGHPRELCPIILWRTKGAEKALTFQFGGRSSKPLLPGGVWRCLALAEVSNVRLREGPWHSGPSHRAAQTCIEEVDYDVNPASPYGPSGRL